jgi:hypothetical protein
MTVKLIVKLWGFLLKQSAFNTLHSIEVLRVHPPGTVSALQVLCGGTYKCCPPQSTGCPKTALHFLECMVKSIMISNTNTFGTEQ